MLSQAVQSKKKNNNNKYQISQALISGLLNYDIEVRYYTLRIGTIPPGVEMATPGVEIIPPGVEIIPPGVEVATLRVIGIIPGVYD